MRSTVVALVALSAALSCAGEEPRRAPVPPPRLAAPEQLPAAPSVPKAATEPAAHVAPIAAVAPQTVAAAAEPIDPRAATRQAAHDALAQNCGECHEGHRSTVAKALAVFDLDLPDWPARFDDHRFASALARLAKKSPAARDAFLAFRDVERAVTKAD